MYFVINKSIGDATECRVTEKITLYLIKDRCNEKDFIISYDKYLNDSKTDYLIKEKSPNIKSALNFVGGFIQILLKLKWGDFTPL